MVHEVSSQTRPDLEHDHKTAQPCPANPQPWDVRRETSATIEAIQQLHQICTPPAAIAKRLHLSEADVRFCIQRNRFPQAELFETEVAE